jgi:large subunit ribosomal protein L29
MALKPGDIRDLPLEDIERQLAETKQELFNLRFQNATGELDNYMRLKELRRDVARILTIMRERELEEQGREE